MERHTAFLKTTYIFQLKYVKVFLSEDVKAQLALCKNMFWLLQINNGNTTGAWHGRQQTLSWKSRQADGN